MFWGVIFCYPEVVKVDLIEQVISGQSFEKGCPTDTQKKSFLHVEQICAVHVARED